MQGLATSSLLKYGGKISMIPIKMILYHFYVMRCTVLQITRDRVYVLHVQFTIYLPYRCITHHRCRVQYYYYTNNLQLSLQSAAHSRTCMWYCVVHEMISTLHMSDTAG